MSTQLPALDPTTFAPPPDAVDFYVESLRLLDESGVPFLLSGTYALSCYTGIVRPTKDLDVFCKPSDAPKILSFFKALGYRIDIEDEPEFLGDEDVENFPTLLVRAGGRTLFYGAMLPHIEHLDRLLRKLRSDDPEIATRLPDMAQVLAS